MCLTALIWTHNALLAHCVVRQSGGMSLVSLMEMNKARSEEEEEE